jgi:predicted PurR-regulated permease PerM
MIETDKNFMNRKVEISHKTIVFTVLFLISLCFLYFIREIILQLFATLLIVAILNPTVAKLSKLKVPKSLSVLVVYICVIGLFVVGIASIIPTLVEQTSGFASNLPEYLASLRIESAIADQVVSQLLSQIGSLPGQILQISLSIFSNILSIVTVLILAFYMLLSHDKLDAQLTAYFGEERGKKASNLVNTLEGRLGGWARGQIALMVLIGLASFVGLTVLGIPYALPLAVLAGIFEIVPYFGPLISGLPAFVIALSISPLMGLITAILIIVIHQVEAYLFIPKVMEKSVGVSPVITLLALAVGFKLAGVVGVLLSVPVVVAVEILGKEYYLKNWIK